MNQSPTRIGIYALDFSIKSTTSLGIYNYTKKLLESLHLIQEPRDIKVVVWVSSSNMEEILPSNLPSWVGVRTVAGDYSRGIRRLWADHVLMALLSRHIDLLYLPKGWYTLLPTGRTRVVCHLHDSITRHYLVHYPHFAGFKMRYFDFLTAHAVRQSDRVISGTRHSLTSLIDAYGLPKSYSLVASGAFRSLAQPKRKNSDAPYLVIGSKRPHKCIQETLFLLNSYAESKSRTLQVRLTSMPEIPTEDFQHLVITFTGRLSEEALLKEYIQARVLVYLSEIEGFGLPPLEALEAGTPVCYRAASSVAELMQGMKGGWDGTSAERFFCALEEACGLHPDQISVIQKRLSHAFSWKQNLEHLLRAFHDTMESEESLPAKRRIGTLDISTLSRAELQLWITSTLNAPRMKQPQTLGCVNAHIYNLANKDTFLHSCLMQLDHLAADGMSIVWASQLFGTRLPERCNMTDIFFEWITDPHFQPVTSLMIGCSEDEIGKASERLKQLQPSCKVVGTHQGYDSIERLVDWVKGMPEVDLILVGMGSPKSEQFIHSLKDESATKLIWHLGGGSIRFLSESDVEAPLWMKRSGLQWLHRLLKNPKKMAGRYIIGNPKFVINLLTHYFMPYSGYDSEK